MKHLLTWLQNILFALLSLFALTSTTSAALPLAANGEVVYSIAPMLKRVTPAVVHIATSGTQVVRQRSPFRGDRLYEQPTQGLGSGVIIDADKGIVVTNAHVIADADQIKVTLKDGRDFEATVLGEDPDADVAVIQIKADQLVSIPLAKSENVQVGDFVVAIGTPFGLEQTVTSGIVSALGRSGLGIEVYENFIQTDASINPGNSGGALVNLKGELVGINTAILGGSGGNIGIGFAIPSNMAKSISEQLIEYGEVRRGMLGVNIALFTPEYAEYFNVSENLVGAIITNVSARSPADKAGLQREDIIVAINDRAVKSTQDLVNRIGLLKAGETIKVDYFRKGERNSKMVTIADLSKVSNTGKNLSNILNGALLSEKSDGQGVEIISIAPDSAAEGSGLNAGDTILTVDQQKIESIEALKSALSSSASRAVIMIDRRGFALNLLIQ